MTKCWNLHYSFLSPVWKCNSDLVKKFKRLQTFLCPELSAFSMFMSSTSLSFKCKKLQVISRCCTNTFSKYLDPEATEEGGVEVIGKSFNSLNKFSFHCFFNWYFRHKVESNLSNDLNVVSLVQTKCWANYRKGHLNMQEVNRYNGGQNVWGLDY